jgi:hypothetical protein
MQTEQIDYTEKACATPLKKFRIAPAKPQLLWAGVGVRAQVVPYDSYRSFLNGLVLAGFAA